MDFNVQALRSAPRTPTSPLPALSALFASPVGEGSAYELKAACPGQRGFRESSQAGKAGFQRNVPV